MIELTFIDEKPKLTINGKEVEIFLAGEVGYICAGYSGKIELKDIENIKFITIPNKMILSNINIKNSQEETSSLLDFISIKKIDNNDCTLEFSGNFETGQWNIKYFYPIFEKHFKTLSTEQDQAWYEFDTEGYYLKILISIDQNYQSKTIKEIVQIYNDKISSVYQETMQELALTMTDNSSVDETIALKFNFPQHLKALCKQYLSYFEKFLLDNGVVCTLSLIDQNDITYMTIKVNESTINIDNLKEALVGYFSLPILAKENMYFESQDIKIQQLLANTEHLKSQLRLANLTIAQYEQLSLPTRIEYVIIDSLHKDSAIELFGGLIKINKMMKFKLFAIDIELDIPLLLEKIKKKS